MSKRSAQGLAFLIEDRPAEAFEQLDSVLRIVSLRHWFFLAVVLLTLVSFAAFSCFYKAPLKVDGRGIILTKDTGGEPTLEHVTTPAAGRLKRVFVKIGDDIEQGKTIAEIDQSELRDQFDEVDAALANLIQEDRLMSRLDQEEATLRASALGVLENTLHENLDRDGRRLDRHRHILEVDRNLKKHSLINDLEAQKNQTEADLVEAAIGATRAKLDELKYDQREDQTRREKEKARRTVEIEKARTKLALISQRLERDTRVVSPYTGKVIDLMITEHALVEKGAVAALLRPRTRARQPMEAIVVVPAGLGKRIGKRDMVEVAPDTVRRQEHGFIRGKVTSISEIPATEAAMLAELKHKNLVSSFAGQFTGQVLLFIHVELEENSAAYGAAGTLAPGVKNPLRWSSSSGAGQELTSGTLCSAAIVVERRPLIVLAFPWLKKMVGYY